MAVRMEVSKERYEAAPDNFEVVTRGDSRTYYMETTHKGLVLYTGEHNYRDDSDFYAVVWCPEKGEPCEVEYGSTRFWTELNSATADATPEVRAAYDAWRAAKDAEEAREAAEEEARVPREGRTVKVVRGRKVPKGTVGTVVWYGAGKRYRYYGSTPMRVGVKDAGGMVHWTDAKNVEVVADKAESKAA